MLQVMNLQKSFGSLRAVDDVSFTIEDGQILGMIGQNGSGKTTTFRLILDFLTPEKGSVLWNGQTLSPKDYNSIGYLPEERGLYPKISIEQQILYFAKLRGKTKEEIAPVIDQWLERFKVKGKKTDKIKSLSKGNQQKVQLITTLIHEPKLVILDEPFSGLDPVNAELLKDAIIDLKAKGTCVIFSSHNMDNVEEICDSLIMLKDGAPVLSGQVNEIRQSFGRTKLVISPVLSMEELLAIDGVESVRERKDGDYLVTLSEASVGQKIFDDYLAGRYTPVFNQQPPTLEEIFKMKAGVIHE